MVELKTKQQKRLHERLDEIQPKIESEDFLKNQGLGNEIGFYVFDYPPESELTVREHLEYMTERLDKRGRNFKSINLFEAIIELLDSRKLTERAFKVQKERGDDALFNALKGPLEQNRVADFNILKAEHFAHSDNNIFPVDFKLKVGGKRHRQRRSRSSRRVLRSRVQLDC